MPLPVNLEYLPRNSNHSWGKVKHWATSQSSTGCLALGCVHLKHVAPSCTLEHIDLLMNVLVMHVAMQWRTVQ